MISRRRFLKAIAIGLASLQLGVFKLPEWAVDEEALWLEACEILEEFKRTVIPQVQIRMELSWLYGDEFLERMDAGRLTDVERYELSEVLKVME